MAEERVSVELRAKYIDALKKLFAKTNGQAWEPLNFDHPFMKWSIKEGYLRRVDGRCGFELLKDQMVDWTDAGKAALRMDDVTRPE